MSFIDDYLAERVAPLLAELAPGEVDQGHLVPPVMVENMRKLSVILPVSEEMPMDCGVIPDTRPRPVLSRRERFAIWRRRKTDGARMAVAGRAYRLISGEDVPEPEDW